MEPRFKENRFSNWAEIVKLERDENIECTTQRLNRKRPEQIYHFFAQLLDTFLSFSLASMYTRMRIEVEQRNKISVEL